MLLKPHHEHRLPCLVGIKRDLGKVASTGGMCVSLSGTRSLDMDDELLAPPAAPTPAIPGVLLVQVATGAQWWQPRSKLPVEEGRGARPTCKRNVCSLTGHLTWHLSGQNLCPVAP